MLEFRVLYAQKQELPQIPREIRERIYPQDAGGTNSMSNHDPHTMDIGRIVDAYIMR